MSTRKASSDNIKDAAWALAQSGQPVNAQAVQRRIGGSLSTISPILRGWWPELKERLTEKKPEDAGLPPGTLGPIRALLDSMAAPLLEHANRSVATERQALEKDRAQLAADRAAWEEERITLRATAHERVEQINSLERERDHTRQECREERTRADQLQVSLEHTEAALDAAAKEVGALRAQLAEACTDRDVAAARADQAIIDRDDAYRERDSANTMKAEFERSFLSAQSNAQQERARHEAEKLGLEDAIAQALLRVEEAHSRYQQDVSRTDQLTSTLRAVEANLAAETATRRAIEDERDRMIAVTETLRDKVEAQAQEIATVRAELGSSREERERLQGALTLALQTPRPPPQISG